MAVTPGTSSGTYNYLLTNAGIMVEAYDRIQIRPPGITEHHATTFRNSLNLELIDWEDDGFSPFLTTSGTINLAVNQATYTLPTNLVILTELWYSNVNGNGAGVNLDRIMVPITRTAYAALTNKLQQGLPTQYWFQMLQVPQITIWEVPFVGAPNYVLNWFGMLQTQDANIASGETPNAPRRALNALTARMTMRMAEKWAPAQYAEKKAIADDAYGKFTRRDQEPGPITWQPNMSFYGRMR